MIKVDTNIKEKFALKLLRNFSIITVGKRKIPNFPWTLQQTTKLSISEFLVKLRHNGGRLKSNDKYRPATEGLGIITGFEGLEVIDVDTKILSTESEKVQFWKEYLTFLRDHIDDFDNKIVIYKTISGGYHLLYKCLAVEPNQNLAIPKGYSKCLIETRGKNGFVMVYPHNQYSKLSYFQVKEITIEDREIIMGISKMYHYHKDPDLKKTKQVKKTNLRKGLSAWDDFNNKTDIWDLIKHEFVIVAKNQKFTTIKRHGANSAWSGYIYHDSGIMKLYSTGTRYTNDSNKSGYLSSFDVYAIQNHDSDRSIAASELYRSGYGDRIVKH